MGDGGFWHNGLATSIGNAVFNQNDGVIVIVDNYYSAATGGAGHPGPAGPRMRRNPLSTQSAMRWQGWGVKWIRQIDRTYDVGKVRAVMTEALTTKVKGPKGGHRQQRMQSEQAAPGTPD